MQKKWESYEDVATFLLNSIREEFGLERVEGKQKVAGLLTGTSWEVDAKGVCSGGKGFVVVECRRYTSSKQNQKALAGLAWTILDSGATGGIIVSPLGLQLGAKKVAQAANVIEVQLNEHATTQEHVLAFLQKVFVGMHDRLKVADFPSNQAHRVCARCGSRFWLQQSEVICQSCRKA